MSAWVVGLGGKYEEGPLKTRARVAQKTYTDYDNDPLFVVDIVRGTAIFVSMFQLCIALESLLSDECELVVVRAKDRLNKPTSFGYMDLLLNVHLASGPHSHHIGELQLHLEGIHAIKPLTHRTYGILRTGTAGLRARVRVCIGACVLACLLAR